MDLTYIQNQFFDTGSSLSLSNFWADKNPLSNGAFSAAADTFKTTFLDLKSSPDISQFILTLESYGIEIPTDFEEDFTTAIDDFTGQVLSFGESLIEYDYFLS